MCFLCFSFDHLFNFYVLKGIMETGTEGGIEGEKEGEKEG
jgi:hypothetical protein